MSQINPEKPVKSELREAKESVPSEVLPVMQCANCQKSICLRQQVVNYALGNDEQLFCLTCLGEQSDNSAQEVVSNLTEYIHGRDCFRKEWVKLSEPAQCSLGEDCVWNLCFEK
jgi:hypothetical protein